MELEDFLAELVDDLSYSDETMARMEVSRKKIEGCYTNVYGFWDRFWRKYIGE